jgi:hypothetical protein
MAKRITKAEYEAAFNGKRADALAHAMEIRKFEIELYWKRAAYFWTFIGASFAGYGAVQSQTHATAKADLTIPLACLGLIFSFGWFCVNKGSKQWQENWENHVDLLEDAKIGPLYRIVLMRDKSASFRVQLGEFLTGPAALSVSRINQLISLYVTLIWLILLVAALFPSFGIGHPGWKYAAEVVLALATCVGFFGFGRTSFGTHRPVAMQRETEIKDPPTL